MDIEDKLKTRQDNKVKIHDMTTGKNYIATCEKDCKNKEDLSAYKTCIAENSIITWGKVLCCPMPKDQKQIFETEPLDKNTDFDNADTFTAPKDGAFIFGAIDGGK